MDNNDLLIRLRYALDIKDSDMIEIFKLGGIEVTRDELRLILTKSIDDEAEYDETAVENIKCDNQMLDAFLNGFIIFHRGGQKGQEGKPNKVSLTHDKDVNNILLKKVRIALKLTSDDILEIFNLAGITVSNSELTAIFRNEKHHNYMECGDKFARNFLKGLALTYRK